MLVLAIGACVERAAGVCVLVGRCYCCHGCACMAVPLCAWLVCVVGVCSCVLEVVVCVVVCVCVCFGMVVCVCWLMMMGGWSLLCVRVWFGCLCVCRMVVCDVWVFVCV